jgi:hypothetical protein
VTRRTCSSSLTHDVRPDERPAIIADELRVAT